MVNYRYTSSCYRQVLNLIFKDMAWFFNPLVFFLFAGIMRFKATVCIAGLDIADSSLFGNVLWIKGWIFWSRTLCRCHVVSFNDYFLIVCVEMSKLNPGPVKFLCVVCHFPVGSNQRAFLCDKCGLWCNYKCCGVSIKYSINPIKYSLILIGFVHFVFSKLTIS